MEPGRKEMDVLPPEVWHGLAFPQTKLALLGAGTHLGHLGGCGYGWYIFICMPVYPRLAFIL